EEVEETLAAAYLLMKGRDERARSPHAGAPPWRIQHRIVETCAQRIMRRPNLLDRNAEVASALFEMAHRAERALTQITGVRLIERVAQPREQLQQRRGDGDERAEARDDGFGIVRDRSDGIRCPRQGRVAKTGCRPPAAGNRPDDGPLCPFGLGKGV